jgi:hypothetical protein
MPPGTHRSVGMHACVVPYVHAVFALILTITTALALKLAPEGPVAVVSADVVVDNMTF